MNDPKINWKYISRYISGECSEQERKEVEKWIASNPRNKELIELLQRAWNSSDESEEHWDVDSAWLRYNIRYSKDFEGLGEDDSQPDEKKRIKQVNSHRNNNSLIQWGVVLAAAAVISIAFLFSYQPASDSSSAPNTLTRQILAEQGQRVHLRLSDGTKVILNSGSQLSTPETFPDSVRSVQLQGEAFFDVVTDSSRPFIIRTRNSVTEVLGTRFGVKAYSSDKRVEVAVEEGRVALRPHNRKINHSVEVITKNQIGTLHEGGKPLVTEVNNISTYLGWTEGKLVFSEDPIYQVEIKLERWYDINIDVEVSRLEQSDRRLTATFTDQQPMSEVLEAVALSLELNYRKAETDGTYILYD